MKTKIRTKLIAATIVTVIALSLFLVKPVSSQAQLQTVFIRPDGSVSPASAPIQQNGNTYTLTDSIYGTIKIQKSHVELDGAGYTLWGPYNGEQSDLWFIGSGTDQLPTSTQSYTIGVDLGGTNVEGVIIENLKVQNFSIGIYVWTKNNTVIENTVSRTVIGVMLSGSNSTVTKNTIANNSRGLFFGFNNDGDVIPPDIVVTHNSFERNLIQLNGCECKDYNTTEPPHNWDNGAEGNYWSDYNGTDTDGDGIGNTPYVIDILNQDRYPLMQSIASQPTATPPTIPLSAEPIVFVIAFVAIALAVLALVFYRRMRKKTLSP